MKIKIFEAVHELDLQDDLNDFLKEGHLIIELKYQVAMCYSTELEYSFSCLVMYEDK